MLKKYEKYGSFFDFDKNVCESNMHIKRLTKLGFGHVEMFFRSF